MWRGSSSPPASLFLLHFVWPEELELVTGRSPTSFVCDHHWRSSLRGPPCSLPAVLTKRGDNTGQQPSPSPSPSPRGRGRLAFPVQSPSGSGRGCDRGCHGTKEHPGPDDPSPLPAQELPQNLGASYGKAWCQGQIGTSYFFFLTWHTNFHIKPPQNL